MFQGFNLLPRTSALENVELPLAVCARRVGRASGGGAPPPPWRRSVSAIGCTTAPTRCRAVSSSAWRSPARSSTTRRCCWPTSRPATSTSRTSVEIVEIFQRLNAERGLTILLVTHERDVAQYATRLVAFRDGRIRVDQPIADRHDAGADLIRLRAEPEWRAGDGEPAMNLLMTLTVAVPRPCAATPCAPRSPRWA